MVKEKKIMQENKQKKTNKPEWKIIIKKKNFKNELCII